MDYTNDETTWFVECREWNELSQIWKGLYKNNPYMTAYQSYEFLTITGKGWSDKRPWVLLGLREKNYILYKKGEAIAIAPLLVRRCKNVYYVYFRGTYTSAGHLDFLYRPDWNYSDFEYLLNWIKGSLGETKFFLDRVSEKSISISFIRKYFQPNENQIKMSKCVSIPIKDNYNNYFNSLSKSIRQNIRTSYNRLNRNDTKMDVVVYFNTSIAYEYNVQQEILKLYCKRMARKNVRGGPLQHIVGSLLRIAKSRNPMLKAMNGISFGFHALLYIDNNLAAFCRGFLCNDNRIIIPQFSIDSTYGWFSPGGLLINETIKKLIEKQDEPKIKEFDLSRGAEKYKYAYGGVTHYNYSFWV